MISDQLTKLWDERRAATPIDAAMRFSDEGLVFGAGTVVAPARASALDVSIDPQEPRLTALLTAAHLGKPTTRALAHLSRAAECRRAGDDALAAMHLVLSHVDRLREPEADAHRLFLADSLLENGAEPGVIVDACASGDIAFDQLRKKYNPDEPRVPAGSGRTSGQWTTGDGPSQQPSSVVNPETVTPVGNTKGSYQGPDACYKARVDCQINVREAAAQDDPRREPFYVNLFAQCSQAELGCEFMDFSVDKLSLGSFGWVKFSDGGVVIGRPGQDATYYPSEIAAIKFPHLKPRY